MAMYRRKQEHELEHRDVQNAPQRIGCFLLRLCRHHDDVSAILHLPYDKSLIATRLGMKAETFSRALSRLRQDTDIQVSGSTVRIDSIKKLSEYF